MDALMERSGGRARGALIWLNVGGRRRSAAYRLVMEPCLPVWRHGPGRSGCRL